MNTEPVPHEKTDRNRGDRAQCDEARDGRPKSNGPKQIPGRQFTLLHMLSAVAIVACLLAFTANLGAYSIPLWIIAAILTLILRPWRQ